MPSYRRNSDVIKDLLNISEKEILDVGCGDGGLTRLLTRLGGNVVGIECNSRQFDKANAVERVGTEQYREGKGEALPVPDSSIDVVIYLNSLHHVPVDMQDSALSEAARVLKSDGLLYICEPVAEGPHFEMLKPFDDETYVRAKALEAIRRVVGSLFEQITEETYSYQVKDASFEDFAEEMTRIDPTRDALFTEQKDALQNAFYTYGEKLPDGRYGFGQPMRVNLMKKIS
jgi:ubiquinone/menaquinone biosynthesis C-methylase UbiE